MYIKLNIQSGWKQFVSDSKIFQGIFSLCIIAEHTDVSCLGYRPIEPRYVMMVWGFIFSMSLAGQLVMYTVPPPPSVTPTSERYRHSIGPNLFAAEQTRILMSLTRMSVAVLQVQIFSPVFMKYTYDNWLDKHGRYPSTGFFSLMFALQICDEVRSNVLSMQMVCLIHGLKSLRLFARCPLKGNNSTSACRKIMLRIACVLLF